VAGASPGGRGVAADANLGVGSIARGALDRRTVALRLKAPSSCWRSRVGRVVVRLRRALDLDSIHALPAASARTTWRPERGRAGWGGHLEERAAIAAADNRALVVVVAIAATPPLHAQQTGRDFDFLFGRWYQGNQSRSYELRTAVPLPASFRMGWQRRS
jgi:hypothetical protein